MCTNRGCTTEGMQEGVHNRGAQQGVHNRAEGAQQDASMFRLVMPNGRMRCHNTLHMLQAYLYSVTGGHSNTVFAGVPGTMTMTWCQFERVRF